MRFLILIIVLSQKSYHKSILCIERKTETRGWTPQHFLSKQLYNLWDDHIKLVTENSRCVVLCNFFILLVQVLQVCHQLLYYRFCSPIDYIRNNISADVSKHNHMYIKVLIINLLHVLSYMTSIFFWVSVNLLARKSRFLLSHHKRYSFIL